MYMVKERKLRIIPTSLAQCKKQTQEARHDIPLTGHVVHEVPLDEQFKTQLHDCFATAKAFHEF
jgi:hypothetical protein